MLFLVLWSVTIHQICCNTRTDDVALSDVLFASISPCRSGLDLERIAVVASSPPKVRHPKLVANFRKQPIGEFRPLVGPHKSHLPVQPRCT